MRLMLVLIGCSMLVAGGCDTPPRDETVSCDRTCMCAPGRGGDLAPSVPPRNAGSGDRPPVAETPVTNSGQAAQPVPALITPETTVPMNQETVVGKLRGGMVGIGAETTGWAIVPHNEQGNLAAVEVDVTAVRASAEKLEGREVRATGVYTVKTGIERGKMRVFVIRTIEAIK